MASASTADKNALKAGLFIIFSLLLAVGIVVTVRSVISPGSQGVRIVFDLGDDVGGLGTGSEVRVGGLRKGQVRGVRFEPELQRIVVDVRLPDDVPLREGANVQVQSTVTGVSWLNIADLGTGEPLADNAELRGTAGTLANLVTAVGDLAPQFTGLLTDMRQTTIPNANRVLGRADETVGAFRDAATELRDAVGPAVDQYGRTIDSARDAADAIKLTADEARRAVESVNEVLGQGDDAGTDLAAAMKNLRLATERLPDLLDDARTLVREVDAAVGQMRETVDDTQVRLTRVLDSAGDAADDVAGIAADTRVTAREVRGIIAGNRGKIDQIVERLRDTGRTLSLASAEIRRSPWRLMYRPDGRQRDNLDLYDTARRFAEGASALQDAAIALQDANSDPTSDANRIGALIDRLDERFREFDRVERELLNRLRE